MKVLLDVGVSPRLRVPLESALGGAPVESAVFHRWRTLRNGELLALARREGFTTLVTTDKRLASEQPCLRLAVVALDDNRLASVLGGVHDIASAIRETPVGSHQVVRLSAQGR